MIHQRDVSIILIGVSRLKCITVIHEHQGQSVLALGQLCHKGPDAFRWNIKSNQHGLQKECTARWELQVMATVQVQTEGSF